MIKPDTASLSRRSILHGIGGLTAYFALPVSIRTAQGEMRRPNESTVDAWIRIDPKGSVYVSSGKAELGQGIQTAFGQIVAEELDVDLARIKVINPDTDRSPDESYTAGSASIQSSGMTLRYASAEIRRHLVKMAAGRLHADLVDIRVEDGEVIAPDGGHITYWALVGGLEINIPISGNAQPKRPADHKFVGTPQQRADLPAKLYGEASYIVDIRLEGMVHGRIVRPPAPKFTLVDVSIDTVSAMDGVISVVRDGSFLGVIAEREEQAVAAAEVLAEGASWDIPPIEPPLEELPERIKTLPSFDSVFLEVGDVNSAGGERFEASYYRPFHAHGSIGPSCAIAQLDGDILTVWSHTQGVYPARRDMANVLGMAESNLRFIHAHGAGCYGHNGADDVAMDAALLARATDLPVRVMWSRQDELAHSPFGTAMRIEIAAELDSNNRLRSYEHTLWSGAHIARPGLQSQMSSGNRSGLMPAWSTNSDLQPYAFQSAASMFGADRNSDPIYDIANKRLTKHLLPEMPLRVSAMRSLGAYSNHYAMESFMDEVAFNADVDPIEFRLQHLSNPRYRAIVEKVAEEANWSGRSNKKGTGRGFAFGRYRNTSGIFAIVVDVHVDLENGEVAISKVVGAIDVGQVINPDGVLNQIEGGIIQSLSWTLMEEVTYDHTGVTSTEWWDYPIMSVAQSPVIELHLIDRPDLPSVGAGEASQGPTAAALANAIFDATGARVRDLPLRPEKILKQMT
ncbi:Nicotinate dehydrogenase subunit B [Pseudovibrio sp. Ad13]|uniref:xanthine dehydrogenase family protein molybdopterin-binding subunit n=1 Tax=Pseudovibrio sp. Ad13 TaxID=989396 RepID=UPI0007AECDDE|nr:molybdopterin cofactor-binding domain-containing protein [Pseudovibrio sp. Ad13]KZK84065.1 Nicotinate dehydrogenase subunit B [Pseudovibrio sp. Ad13]